MADDDAIEDLDSGWDEEDAPAKVAPAKPRIADLAPVPPRAEGKSLPPRASVSPKPSAPPVSVPPPSAVLEDDDPDLGGLDDTWDRLAKKKVRPIKSADERRDAKKAREAEKKRLQDEKRRAAEAKQKRKSRGSRPSMGDFATGAASLPAPAKAAKPKKEPRASSPSLVTGEAPDSPSLTPGGMPSRRRMSNLQGLGLAVLVAGVLGALTWFVLLRAK